ncbi:MAG: methyltransferase domain-containing protein [Candidatus Parcubacteria bacterium]|nr:methyltransferase domain-containing protein [Candidatus Parcubacteria bacterium]
MMLNPEETIKPLLLLDDSLVADFGAGSGVFTVAATKYVHSGKVYAVEIQRELLPLIIKKVDAEHLKNVEILWGNIEEIGGSKIKEASLDAVIFANTLFQTEDKHTAVLEIKRVLKNGGKLLLVDWAGSFGNVGPKEETVVSQDIARAMFEEQGFVFLQEAPAGEYHYGMILICHKT